MKKWIAGAALVTTIMGTAGPALAETTTTPAPTTTATTTATTTTAPAPTTTTTTDASATATTTAPSTPATTDTTTAPAATATTTAPATTDTTTAPAAPSTQADAGTNVNATLPQVSVTPDSFFYSLKLFLEKLRLAITTNAVQKATVLEQQAQTRMAEAQAMATSGQADLAAQALGQAKADFAAAQQQIQVAVKANKDVTQIEAKVSADQTRFAQAISGIITKAPDDVKALVEPQAADLLVQVAATQDAAKPDPKVEEQAKALEEQSEHKQELASLQPRMVLVLNAMAQASGKKFDDVMALYLTHPGLGNLAHQLGLKMGPVQHAAQIQWKLMNSGVAQSSTTASQPATTAPATQPAPTTAQAPTPAPAPQPSTAQTPSTESMLNVLSAIKAQVNAKHEDGDKEDEKDDEKGGHKGAEKSAEHGNAKQNGKSQGKGH